MISKFVKTLGVGGLLGLVAVAGSMSLQAQDLPAVTFGEADLVSPTGTLTFSDSLCDPVTGGGTTCYSPPAETSPYILKMSRALGANRPDVSDAEYTKAVFDYVYQNIKITPLFGLQKGGVGALIDGYGTAFDQAQLMALLLKEDTSLASKVSYKFGTLNITQANAANWLGLAYSGTDNQAALTRVLSSGGIPAAFSGSNVTIKHIWLTVDGTTYDPSYKHHTYKNGKTRQQLLGCSGGTCGTAAVSAAGGNSTTTNGIPTLSGFTVDGTGGLNEHLKNKAISAMANISRDDELDDIIGGHKVDVASTPAAALSGTRSGTTWSSIPNEYRTQFGVQFDNINVAFYADEIYGKRMNLMGEMGTDNSGSAERTTTLFLNNYIVGTSTISAGTLNNDDIILSVNHPYSAASTPSTVNDGTYMDVAQTLKTNTHGFHTQANNVLVHEFSPLAIVHDWGNTGPGFSSHLSRLLSKDQLGILTTEATATFVDAWTCAQAAGSQTLQIPVNGKIQNPSVIVKQGCLQQEYLMQAAAWSVQTSKALKIVGRVTSTSIQAHHNIGVTSANGLNVVSGLSAQGLMSSSTESETARKTASNLSSLVLNRLEAGMAEQFQDVWTGNSAVSLLALSNQQGHELLHADSTAVLTHLVNYTPDRKAVITDYIQAGYNVILPKDGEAGAFSFGADTFTYTTSSFWAYKPDGSYSALIVADKYKGAGGTPDVAGETLKSAGLLEEADKDQKLYDVSLASGDINLQSATDLVTGSGDFPYSLPFTRSYTSGTPSSLTPVKVVTFPAGSVGQAVRTFLFPETSGGLGAGWSHNYDITANISSDGMQGLGQDSALDAVSTITAFHILADTFEHSSDFKSRLVGTLATHWWGQQFQANAVFTKIAGNSQKFIRLPDGTYNAPPLSNDTLLQTGERSDPLLPGSGITFLYDDIELQLHSANGQLVDFDNPDRTRQFRGTTWRFPNNVTVTLEYFPNDEEGDGYKPRLKKVSNNLGRSLTFETGNAVYPEVSYSPILSVTDDSNRVVTYNYNYVGNIFADIDAYLQTSFEVTNTENDVTRYEYLASSTSGRNEFSNPITAVYLPTDSSGSPSLSIEYDDLMHVVRVEDKRGDGTDYYVAGIGDEMQRTGAMVNALDEKTYSVFNEDGAPVETVEAVGTPLERTTTMVYNDLGQLVRTDKPEDDYTLNEYDGDYNLVKRTWYNKAGNTSYSAQASYGTKNYTYSGGPQVTIHGVLDWVKDAEGNQTDFTFNSKGQLTKVQYPATATASGSVRGEQTFTYNTYGQPETVENQEGIVTKYTYSSASQHSQLTSVIQNFGTDPADLNLTSSFTYDDVGNQTSVDGPLGTIDGKGDIVTTLYDDMRRPEYAVQGAFALANANNTSNTLSEIEGTAGVEAYSKTEYDAAGRPRFARSRGLVSGTWEEQAVQSDYTGNCSGNGQVCQTISPDNAVTSYTYDALNRVDVVTDGEGRKTKTEYDALGRVSKVYQAYDTTSVITYQSYTYTLNGQVETVTDANGNKTTYEYDGFDRLSKTRFPNKSGSGSSNSDYEQYEYDNNGNMTAKRTRANNWVLNTYDALNRLEQKQIRRGSKTGTLENTVGYTYLLDGRDDVITQSGGTTADGTAIPDMSLAYTYDNAGRQTHETVTYTASGESYITEVALDAAGNKVMLKHPADPSDPNASVDMQVNYTYDYLSRLTNVGLWSNGNDRVTFDYDGFSRRTAKTMFDGSSSNSVADTSYGYAKDSALTALDHNLSGSTHDVDLGFNYNAVNQMVGTDISNATYNYQGAFQQQHLDYDVNGLNQYTEIDSLDEAETVLQTSNMVYDGNGNLTSDGSWTYSYDSENRLVKAHKTDNSQTTTFEYGPKGRRHASVSNSARTEYVYDGDEPIADYASSGQVLRQYVNGQAIDERLMYLEYADNGGGTYTYTVSHYYRNHQGSIIALSKSTDGTLLEKYTYDAYGNIGQGEGGGQPFRYTGRRYDAETGLYYYRARYYSPKLGRFLQTDPIGYEDNMNMYGYTGNDPVNGVDPSGLVTCTVKTTTYDVTATINGTIVGEAVQTQTSIESCRLDGLTLGAMARDFVGFAAMFAAHKIGEAIFEQDNLEGEAFENQMQGVLESGEFPDGVMPTYAQAKWLYKNGGGKTISVDGSLYAPIVDGSNMVGAKSGDWKATYSALKVMGRERLPYETSRYDFFPVRAQGHSPKTMARNVLNTIAIIEHGTGSPFDFEFRK